MIEKILNKLNLIPHDKALHGYLGLVAYEIVFFISNIWLIDFISALIACTIIIILAISKEIYDLVHKENHTSDMMDIVWTIAIPVLITFKEIYYGLV